MGIEAAEGQPDERQAERARLQAQSRKRTLRQVRDARDRLTSTTGTKRSFDYELMRVFAQNKRSAGLAIALIAAATGWVAGWVSNSVMGGAAALVVLAAHGFCILVARSFLKVPADRADLKSWRLRFVMAETVLGLAWVLASSS